MYARYNIGFSSKVEIFLPLCPQVLGKVLGKSSSTWEKTMETYYQVPKNAKIG